MDGHVATPQLAANPPAARSRPRVDDLFRAGVYLGTIGFGGGLSVLANIQSYAVTRKRWLTDREFTNAVTVAQMLPGGASANALAYIGLRFAGWRGALGAYVGFVLPGFVSVLLLAWAYVRFGTTPNLATLLGGFNAAVVGIIASITLKMVRTSVSRLWQMGVAALALLFSAVGNAPPGEIVLVAIAAGLAVDQFAPRLAFFFNCHNNVFQEVAKFRAARRMWAQIMRERFGATDPRSLKLRFHTQTGGVTLTAQQPENNISRVALQAFAAVCGGTQSLHTNGFDEALALPSEKSAKIAVRTQQIVAHESGAADTVDPFAGSFFVEALTDEIESRASELIAKVDELGGSVNAIEFITGEIDESAWGYQERYRIGQDVVVGVNRFVEDDPEVPSDLLRIDPDSEHRQVERLKAFKADRDAELVERRLEELRDVARGTGNLLPAIRAALKDRCSLGEVCGAMADVFGRYTPTF